MFSGYFEAGAQLDLTDDGLRVSSPGKFTKMVDAVEHVTFAGQRALRTGQEVLYVTERCVMRLTEGGLVATEIMPGMEPERDIVAASGGARQRGGERRDHAQGASSRRPPWGGCHEQC